jgi:fucose 4-O-acetylase-like acetyltransferase
MTSLAAPAAPPAAARRGGGKRLPFWDNARWASITLVVIGHGIQRLTSGSDHALELYIFIYAFHMPAFAIISGYFSKATPPGRRQMIKLVTDILIPYLLLQAVWSLVQYFAEGKNSGFNPAEPHWTLWFLVALAIFRVALPYLVLLRWPLFWSVIFSIGVGYLNSVDSTFALSRAIALLPFFLLGWHLRQWRVVDRLRALRGKIWLYRAVAVAIFAIWGTIVIVFIKSFRAISLQNWFMYDESYSSLGQSDWWSGFVRLGVILLSVLLSFCFLTLVPRRLTWFSSLGQATMYVYLLHSFILYPLRESGVLKGEHSDATWLVSMVLACIGISIALSSPLIRRIFRPLIEPKPLWLFTKEEKPAIEHEEAHPARQGQRDVAGKMSRIDPTGSRRDRDRGAGT